MVTGGKLVSWAFILEQNRRVSEVDKVDLIECCDIWVFPGGSCKYERFSLLESYCVILLRRSV